MADNDEIPGLDALDALDNPAAPELEEVAAPEAAVAEDVSDETETEDAGEEAESDPVFEALLAKDPDAAERYVAYQEAQAAAAAEAAKPKAEVVAIAPEDDDATDIGITQEAEQAMNAVAFREKLVQQSQAFEATAIQPLYTKATRLYQRALKAAEQHGEDSEEYRDLAEDYEQMRTAYAQALQVKQNTTRALTMLDGIDRLVNAVPALKAHRTKITHLVDQGILDPTAPSATIKAVLRQHLPKAAAPSGKGKAKPAPDKIAELRKRLGSSRGSGSTSAQAMDGAPRQRPASHSNLKLSAESLAALELIGGGPAKRNGTR